MEDHSAQSPVPENSPSPVPRLNLAVRGLQAVTGPWTRRNLLSWLFLLLTLAVLKGCIMDQYTIPSGSMEPTLLGDPRFFRGDRVLVDKLAFGMRIPFTKHWLGQWGAPRRWDIVVFQSVDPNAKHPVLIKRVVGLPGEEVQIKDGAVYINGERMTPPADLKDTLKYTREFELEKMLVKRHFLELAQSNQPMEVLNPEHAPVKKLYADMDRVHGLLSGRDPKKLSDAEVEELCRDVARASLNMVRHLILYLIPDQPVFGIREEPEFRNIPKGHYFLLGDNSGHSADGRVWGWLPRENLVGRAFAVWWPWPHRRDFTGFSHTLWGKSLLFGIPALLVLLEAAGWWRQRRRQGG